MIIFLLAGAGIGLQKLSKPPAKENAPGDEPVSAATLLIRHELDIFEDAFQKITELIPLSGNGKTKLIPIESESKVVLLEK